MIITKKAMSRRTALRGLGVTLALPLLDSMVPALTALQRTAAKAVRRLGVVYLPNGMAMDYWLPKSKGPTLDVTPVLEPLTAFRNRLLLLSGLTSRPVAIDGNANHACASSRFLTGVEPKPVQGAEIRGSVSMDQIAAQHLGQHTQLASLELNLDARDFAGTCDLPYSCAYTNTISWRDSTTPLPMENNPRVVFERLFGDGNLDAGARLAQARENRSVLDSVRERATELARDLGPSDRTKLSQYLEAVRDVERRIQRAEEQGRRDLPSVEQPPGIPATFEEHANLMFDLQVLAYESDLTRVITFMIGRELSGRTYPEIGVPDAHHPLSHHENDPAKIATMSKINIFHTTLFARYLDKLRSTQDGEGSLLDTSLILYGCGMSNSNGHVPDNLPLLLVGKESSQHEGGRHLSCPDRTPVTNLHLTLLDKLGVSVDSLGNSTGELELLSDV